MVSTPQALLTAYATCFALAACAIPERLDAVPEGLHAVANVPGIPGVRYYIPDQIDLFVRNALDAVERENTYYGEAIDGLTSVHFLAISGGGDNGAFGAGLLVGWGERGDRPEFKIVTGISTGALIAPFAFLGSDYDDELQQAYTNIEPHNIYILRSMLQTFLGDAAADADPLKELVSNLTDREMLQAIASEYAKGRLLFVMTTDLDARRPVIWNMGAIASSSDPGALDLFRTILLASSAIPAFFPPIMIEVEVDGSKFQEMHVDGGTLAQTFIYPPSIEIRSIAQDLGMDRDRFLYIIRNASLKSEWMATERRTLSIASRAIDALIFSQGIGDLYRIYTSTQRDGIDFNLADIPVDFDHEHTEQFDREYMRALFSFGYNLGVAGYDWQKYPPGLQAPIQSVP